MYGALLLALLLLEEDADPGLLRLPEDGRELGACRVLLLMLLELDDNIFELELEDFPVFEEKEPPIIDLAYSFLESTRDLTAPECGLKGIDGTGRGLLGLEGVT
jgi:hypothetical protein